MLRARSTRRRNGRNRGVSGRDVNSRTRRGVRRWHTVAPGARGERREARGERPGAGAGRGPVQGRVLGEDVRSRSPRSTSSKLHEDQGVFGGRPVRVAEGESSCVQPARLERPSARVAAFGSRGGLRLAWRPSARVAAFGSRGGLRLASDHLGSPRAAVGPPRSASRRGRGPGISQILALNCFARPCGRRPRRVGIFLGAEPATGD
jgi:hypothetical protein